MRYSARLALIGVCLLLLGGATARAADNPRLVCLVAAISGQVWLSPDDGPKKTLELFTRLREGERLELPQGSSAQLAFLQRGVRETWSGPATVLITAAGGQSPNGPNVPVTEQLPTRAKPAGVGSSILSQGGEQATAQTMTRDVTLPEDKPLSDAQKAELAQVEQQVAAMRQNAAAGDVTPDIVLLEEYTRLQQLRHLNELLDKLRTAYPNNPALANWGK